LSAAASAWPRNNVTGPLHADQLPDL
jgi:hypothetical protein